VLCVLVVLADDDVVLCVLVVDAVDDVVVVEVVEVVTGRSKHSIICISSITEYSSPPTDVV